MRRSGARKPRLLAAGAIGLVVGSLVGGALFTVTRVDAAAAATARQLATVTAEHGVRDAFAEEKEALQRQLLGLDGSAAAATRAGALVESRLDRLSGLAGHDIVATRALRTAHARYDRAAVQLRSARQRGAHADQLASAVALERADDQLDVLFRTADGVGGGQLAGSLHGLDTTERMATLGVAAGGLAGVLAMVLLGRALSMYRRRASEAQARELENLRSAALSDSLTGLCNHRAFHEALAARDAAGGEVCIAMLDLDGLKATNDLFGHQAGDERIIAVADALRAAASDPQDVFRLGGDEFAAILDDASDWDGYRFAQRVQALLRTHSIADPPTVAAGISSGRAPTTARIVLRQADLALISAKASAEQLSIYAPGLEQRRGALRDAAADRVRAVAAALARAVDAKDAYTRSHCQTVSQLSALIATELGLNDEHVANVRLAGLLHDVGKIGVADAILLKAGRLTPEEAGVMQTHATLGERIVQGAGLDELGRWIRHHHERLDGRGYPDGLEGDAIPFESRIILVADAFEAMTSDRPYRSAQGDAAALGELAQHVGRQFDGVCVEALGRALARRVAATAA